LLVKGNSEGGGPGFPLIRLNVMGESNPRVSLAGTPTVALFCSAVGGPTARVSEGSATFSFPFGFRRGVKRRGTIINFHSFSSEGPPFCHPPLKGPPHHSIGLSHLGVWGVGR